GGGVLGRAEDDDPAAVTLVGAVGLEPALAHVGGDDRGVGDAVVRRVRVDRDAVGREVRTQARLAGDVVGDALPAVGLTLLLRVRAEAGEVEVAQVAELALRRHVVLDDLGRAPGGGVHPGVAGDVALVVVGRRLLAD